MVSNLTGKQGWWIGKNFKPNSVGWGGNRFTGARSAAQKLGSRLGVATKVLGAVTSLISAGQAINDFSNGNVKQGAIHSADAIMGVVSLFGPIGAAASGIYFVSRMFWGNDDD